MDEHIFFTCNDIQLEGFLNFGTGDHGVVITHPHPLYGGDMNNPVVHAIAKAYHKIGYTTLRFNFRGVGISGGSYDNGAKEQTDVLSAIDFLKNKKIKKVDLSGYSFGTWINALSAPRADIDAMIMVSPPVAMIPFKGIAQIKPLTLIVTGGNDDIAPPGLIEKLLPDLNKTATLKVINGADHFYNGYLNKLETVLTATLKPEE